MYTQDCQHYLIKVTLLKRNVTICHLFIIFFLESNKIFYSVTHWQYTLHIAALIHYSNQHRKWVSLADWLTVATNQKTEYIMILKLKMQCLVYLLLKNYYTSKQKFGRYEVQSSFCYIFI